MKWIRKYNKFRINESAEIDSLCAQYDIKNYTINTDGTIDVDGDVRLNNLGLEKLPLRFGRVTGTFTCENNNLTTLEGCPKYVGVGFYCRHNKLKDLVGGPEVVGTIYMAPFNQIETLEGCNVREVGQGFALSHNKLKNLVGCPVGLKCYYSFGDNELVSLKGAPEIVNGDFGVGFNQIESLEDSTLRVVGKRFECSNNKLKSLKGGPQETGVYAVNNNQLTDLFGSPISCESFICSNNKLRTLKGVKSVDESFNFEGNNISVIEFDEIEFLECKNFTAESMVNLNSDRITNPVYRIVSLFENYNQFKFSLEFNYLRHPNIINRMRFDEACQDAGIKMPESIEGYVFE